LGFIFQVGVCSITVGIIRLKTKTNNAWQIISRTDCTWVSQELWCKTTVTRNQSGTSICECYTCGQLMFKSQKGLINQSRTCTTFPKQLKPMGKAQRRHRCIDLWRINDQLNKYRGKLHWKVSGSNKLQ